MAAQSQSAAGEVRTTPRPAPAREPGWRLSPNARKATLLVHVASAGAWLGLDIAMAVVVFTAVASDDESKKALCYRALDLFVVWPLLTTGLVCLASGLLLGYGTVWGIFKHWWVVTKLGLNLVLTGLVPIALWPEVTKLADAGRDFVAGGAVTFDESNIIFPPIVSPAALLIAFILAIWKPWGRIRKDPRRRQ
ncbi:MAG: hypothetical protein ACM3S1_05110 [Hyphomicrobiales bacterium]